jgi:fibronectin-binding autotransporter adhesin
LLIPNRLKRDHLAVAVQLALTFAAGMYAPRVRAQQITCPVAGTTTISVPAINGLVCSVTGALNIQGPGGSLDNTGELNVNASGTIDNAGTLINNLYLLNSGTVTNNVGGLLNNAGYFQNYNALVNYGTLDNSFLLINAQSGASSLTNHGTLTSTGVLYNIGGAAVRNYGTLTTLNQLANYGSLRNDGHLQNGDSTHTSAVLFNGDTGELRNHGVLDNAGTIHNHGVLFNGGPSNNGTLNNSGTLNNHATGTIHNYGDLANTGTLSNAGTFNNAGRLINLGTATSSGTFTNVSYGTLYNGDPATTPAATFTNSGALTGLRLTNYANATFTNTGTGTVTSESVSNSGAIVNSGGTMTLGGGGMFNSAGATLSNAATLHIDNPLISEGAVGNSGTLNNNGQFWNMGSASSLTNSGTINNAATKTLLVSAQATFTNNAAGTLNNAGSLTNIGAAIVNSGTIINQTGGVLSISDGPSGPGTMTNSSLLNNYGGATVDNQATLTSTGTIANNGAFNNAGTLTNTGFFGNYSGGSLVNSGTLNNGNGGGFRSYANSTVVNSGIINISGSPFVNYGALTNSGTINNTAGGVLAVDALGTLTNTATGTLNNAAMMANFGVVANSGTLVVMASGTLNGSGTLTQSAGMLRVDGTLTQSALTINGGTLSGTGTINAPVVNSGTLLPGNTGLPGTLTINGSLTQNPGATFVVNVNPFSTSRVTVNGTATIAGTVHVSGVGVAGTPATIVSATGGVTGTFSGVTSTSAFLAGALSYDPNTVFLTLTQVATFDSVAMTPNQTAVSTLLGAVRTGGDANLQAALNAILTMPADQARAAYDNLAGASQPAAAFNAQFGMVDGFVHALTGRLGGAGSGNVTGALPVQLASAGATLPSLPSQSRDGVWALAYGNDGKTSGDGNAAGYRQDGAGIAFGADTDLDRNWRIGGAINLGTQRAKLDEGAGSFKTDGVSVAAYARCTSGVLTVDGIAGFGRNGNDSTRAVNVGGMGGTASADYDSDQRFAHLEFSIKRYRIEPIAALSYVRVESPSYTESGAGGLSLTVDAAARESIKSYLGARSVHELGASLKLTARALWTHEFGDADDSISTARFTGAPAAGAFQTTGPDLKRDGVLLGLGLAGDWKRNLALFGDLAVEARDGQWNAAVFAGGRYTW